MYKSTALMLNDLTAQAHEHRRCIVPDNPTLQRELGRLKAKEEVFSPWRGMFVQSGSWDDLDRGERMRRVVRTLALKHKDWVFCGMTAALMHGLQVDFRWLLPLNVAISDRCRTKSTRKITRYQLGAEPIVTADGVQVTSLERTVLDCLVDLDFRRGLAIADSALSTSGLPDKHFADYVRSRTDVFGWKRALDPLAWANARSANGGESVARAVMIEQGFMVPKLQVEVPNVIELGEHYFADFLWELDSGQDVAGELDGIDKYVAPEMTGGRSIARVMSNERRRESRLGASGLSVVRFSFAEVENVETFTKLLDAFGIPRGPARPRGRVR